MATSQQNVNKVALAFGAIKPQQRLFMFDILTMILYD